jgi:ubiquinone/menaquinone biosynthesis C-methylase UbiE
MHEIVQNKKEEIVFEDKLYDGIQPQYNKYFFERAPAPLFLYSDFFIHRLQEKDIVLEIGCGTGFFITWIQREGNFFAIGLDISKNALLIGEINSTYRNIIVHFILSDAERFPINSQNINVILSLDLLHHFPSHIFLFKEGNRVLKKNGIIIIFEPNPFNPLIFLETIFYIIKHRGYKWRSINERHHTIYFYLSNLKKYFYIEKCTTIRYVPLKLIKFNLLKKIDSYLSKIPIINRFGYVIFLIAKKY